MCNVFTEKGGVKKGRPKAAKSPKPVKPPKGAKSPKLAAKSPKKKKTTKKLLTKSPPKKKSKREMGTEKARRIESDRISSLILASVGDFSETKGKKSTSVSSLAEAGPSTVAESPSAVVKSPSSCATPIAASSVIGSSPQSIECSERELDSDSFSYSGSYYDYETPAASPPAAKPVQYTPPSYGPPSTAPYPGMYPPYQQPPYGQQRPYMLSHTYSWPSSSEVSSLCSTFIQLCVAIATRVQSKETNRHCPFHSLFAVTTSLHLYC